MKRLITWMLSAGLAFASMAQAQTVEYIHTDALGTPVAVTDINRNVIERSEYEPFGAVLNRPVKDGPGFTGHVEDAATGLTYMQQRYYDPQIGRFLSVDPVTALDNGDMRHFNRYAYGFNNPYKFNDPDGRAPESVMDRRYVYSGLSSDQVAGVEAQHRANGEQAAKGMAAGAAAGTGLAGARWLLTTKAGKETLLAVLGVVSRNDDELQKVGKRVQRETVAQMKEARKNAVDEAQQRVKIKPREPPKPPKSTKLPEPPKPREPTK